METATMSPKKEHVKLSPEPLFAVYQECLVPGAPIKAILERNGLNPWDLAGIRKKVRAAALDALTHQGTPGRPHTIVSAHQYDKTLAELQQAKDALAAVGHKRALLKKRPVRAQRATQRPFPYSSQKSGCCCALSEHHRRYVPTSGMLDL